MMGTTHVFVGAAAAMIVTGRMDTDVIFFSAVGALLPDIDHPGSALGRWVNLGMQRGSCITGAALFGVGLYLNQPWVSAIGMLLFIVGLFPHRSMTHSLVALFGTASLAYFFCPELIVPVVIPLLVGYASHLVLDLVSGGVALFWPWPRFIGYRVFFSDGLANHALTLLAIFTAVGFWCITHGYYLLNRWWL